MKPIDCVLFDLDGTILDTYQLILESFRHTIRTHLDREPSLEEMIPCIGEPLWVSMERLGGEQGPDLLKTYREFNLAHHDEMVRVFPGVLQTLEKLWESGIKMGVVTSKMSLTAWRGLKLFNMNRFMKTCIALEDSRHHKPHPEPILNALNRLEAHPSRALMVGDSPVDILAAKNAGVKSVLVGWSIHPLQEIQAIAPDHIINTFPELLKLIPKISC